VPNRTQHKANVYGNSPNLFLQEISIDHAADSNNHYGKKTHSRVAGNLLTPELQIHVSSRHELGE
jgi:hypothetical protein